MVYMDPGEKELQELVTVYYEFKSEYNKIDWLEILLRLAGLLLRLLSSCR